MVNHLKRALLKVGAKQLQILALELLIKVLGDYLLDLKTIDESNPYNDAEKQSFSQTQTNTKQNHF